MKCTAQQCGRTLRHLEWARRTVWQPSGCPGYTPSIGGILMGLSIVKHLFWRAPMTMETPHIASHPIRVLGISTQTPELLPLFEQPLQDNGFRN